MAWNPDTYNKFKSERYQPYYDLVSHIEKESHQKIIDLGCGTGELTKFLAETFEDATVLGIDTSAEMLAKAPEHKNLSFEQKSIEEQVREKQKWDVIFSNAALQWVDDHDKLFSELVSLLAPNGQLAVQMPSQTENILNKILLQLVQEKPYSEALHNWKRISPVLPIEHYTTLFFEKGGKNFQIYEKVYPIIAQTADALYEFISGSALIPYMERLEEELQYSLAQEFKRRIAAAFPKMPAVYAFKRIILYARF